MYCEKCGTKVKDDALFCQSCGSYMKKVQTDVAVQTNKEIEKNRQEVLIWGILSLAFSAIPGIIFASIAIKKAAALEKINELNGLAVVGNILGKVGLGISIGTTVFLFLYFSFLISMFLVMIFIGSF